MRVFLPLLLLVVACQPPSETGPDSAPDERVLPVATEAARSGTVADPVRSTGTVAPSRQVTVSSEGSGRVLSVLVGLGDPVRRGDTLARLDSTVQEAQLEQAAANLRGAEARHSLSQSNFERAQGLLEQGATSTSLHFQSEVDLSAAVAGVDGARAAVTLAERAVNDCHIRAPWAGTVASVALNEGALIGPGTPSFRLVDLDPVRIDVGVPAREIGLISPGQPVRVDVPSQAGLIREGIVARVGPEADPRSRTFPVEIELPNPEGDLRPGMVARAAVVVGEREGVTMVPEGAVLAGNPALVYVIADGRASRREVALGRGQDGFIEVTGDVKPNDLVATLGRQHLSDGAKVTVYELQSDQPAVEATAAAPRETRAGE